MNESTSLLIYKTRKFWFVIIGLLSVANFYLALSFVSFPIDTLLNATNFIGILFGATLFMLIGLNAFSIAGIYIGFLVHILLLILCLIKYQKKHAKRYLVMVSLLLLLGTASTVIMLGSFA